MAIKQIAGYNEEILDLCLLGTDSHLVVITNTEQIRLYDVKTRDCSIVYGHSDIVISSASSFDKTLLITGSKDNSAKLWQFDSKTPLTLASSLLGHTGPVSAVGFSKQSNKFVITASEDRTIKLWLLDDLNNPKSKFTFQAHEKDIQSIDVAPNDLYFVSAGLDKVCKMWSVEDGSLLGVFKGHKRGVWKAKFSPIDQALVTCSTDKTIKLWNVRDFSCIRTFEGHLNTVLNISFVSSGTQLLSAGSDGLVKLWNAKDGECVNTFDNHEDRIWALAIDQNESYAYTGSSDSTITIWKDVTEQEKLEKEKVEDEKIIKY